jgi:hypothetical protein
MGGLNPTPDHRITELEARVSELERRIAQSHPKVTLVKDYWRKNPYDLQNLPKKGWMKHQTISFIKSGIRIVGYAALIVSIPAATILLLLSEAVGIVEEIGHE